MSSTHKIVSTNPSTGVVNTGLTVTLKWGSSPINGQTPGGTVGVYTESPASSGAYEITISETNQYTIVVTGAVQTELEDVWLLADDVITLPFLSSTSASKGASQVGLQDSAGRFTATTVEAALAELAGSGRTTQTVKSVYDIASANATILSGITNADLVDLTDGGASTAHTHDARYYTETELNSSGVPTLRVSDGGSLKAVSGGSTGDIILGSGSDSSGDMGDITIDAHTATASRSGGNVLVDLRAGSGGTPGTFKVDYDGTKYDVITEWEAGDLDFSNAVYLSRLDNADAGLMTRCFRELDSRVAFAIRELTGGNNNFYIAYAREKAQTLGDISAASALSWGTWYVTGVGVKEALQLNLPYAELNLSKIRVYFNAMHDTGTGGGYVRVSIIGPSYFSTQQVTATSMTPYYVEIELDDNTPYPVELLIEIGNTSAGTITLREDIVVAYL